MSNEEENESSFLLSDPNLNVDPDPAVCRGELLTGVHGGRLVLGPKELKIDSDLADEVMNRVLALLNK